MMTWLGRFLNRSSVKDNADEGRKSTAAGKEPPQLKRPGATVLRTAGPTAGAAVPPASPLPAFSDGARIADIYTIKRRVGAGAMGTVYLARHEQWDHDVVLKIPNAEILADLENRHRIVREAEVWTDLGMHPHIAYCYYVHMLDGIPVMVIEYLDGGNLRDWIAAGKCAELKVGLDLVCQFCHALEHAHAKGVVHRDIKPENVLLAKDGTLKLTDFGIARAAYAEVGKADGHDIGQPGHTVGSIGTYEYMSPEQFENAHEIDARADIFAFGVCLYEMFCGRRPYEIAVGQRQPLPEPAALRGDEALPQQLCELMKSCIDWDRDRRPASAVELNKLLREIRKSLNQEESNNEQLLFLPALADIENNRAMSYLALGNVERAEQTWVSALTADPKHLEANYNYGLHLWRSGRMTDDALVQKLQDLGSSDGGPTLPGLLIAKVHLERGDGPSARRVLEQLGTANVESEQVLASALRMDEGNSFEGPIVFDGLAFSAVELSAGGRYAFTGDADGELGWWDLTGPRCLHKFLGHEERITCLSLTHDGRYLVSGSVDHTLRMWDLTTRLCVRVLKGHSGAVKTLSLAAGSGLAVSSSEDGVVKLWDLYKGRCLRDYTPANVHRPAHLKSPDLGHNSNSVGDARLLPNGAFILEVHEAHKTMPEVKILEAKGPYRWVGSLSVDWNTGDSFTALDIGADSLTAVSGHWDGAVRFWDLRRQSCIQMIGGRYVWVRSVMLRENSSQAVALTAENREYGHAVVTFWGTSNGRCLRSMKLPGHSPRRLLTSNGADVFVWSDYRVPGRAGTALVRVNPTSQPSPLRLSKGASSSAAMRAASIYRDALRHARRLIDSGEILAGAAALREARSNIAFKRAAEAVKDWASLYVRLRRKTLLDGWECHSMPSHSSAIADLRISNDLRWVSSCDSKAKVQIWDLSNSTCVRQFHVQELSPYGRATRQCISLTPDGRYIAVGGENRTIKLYEVQSSAETGKSIESDGWIDTFGGSKEGQTYTVWYTVGNNDTTIWENGLDAWPGATGKCLGTSRDGRHIVYQPSRFLSRIGEPTTDEDCLRDLSKVLCTLRSKHDRDRVWSICFSPCGRFLASAGLHFGPEVYDLDHGRRLPSFPFQSKLSSIVAIQFTLDGMGVVRIYEDGGGEVLDVATASLLNRWTGPGIRAVARIGPDSRFVVYCSRISAVKQRITLVETATGLALNSFEADSGEIACVALSADARNAVTGGPDKVLRVWDLGKGYCMRSFAGHVDAITTVDLSADARYALSGGSEGSIKVWFLDWDLDENELSDWDPLAKPYLEAFLRAHQPYASKRVESVRQPGHEVAQGLSRAGKPVWSEADFQQLLYRLGCGGYGWLRPEGVRKELKQMAANYEAV